MFYLILLRNMWHYMVTNGRLLTNVGAIDIYDKAISALSAQILLTLCFINSERATLCRSRSTSQRRCRMISNFLEKGPSRPDRLLLVLVAILSSLLGIMTGSFKVFFITFALSIVLGFIIYAAISRFMKWKSLSFDFLLNLIYFGI